MTRKQYLQYAVFAAEQAIHIYEKKNAPEKLMHDCIDAAKAVIENDTEENRKKSDAAGAAAWDAAGAAAWDAAMDAAWAAAGAAGGAAWAAAWDAAMDAAWAAAGAAGGAMLKKILKYGVSLLK
jgi:hypothetical protein